MVLKRHIREGFEGGSRLPFKQHRKDSSLFRGVDHDRMLQESVSCLEPMIRKIVQEAVARAIDPYLRISENQVGLPRRLQLQFCSKLPQTLFTNSRVLSDHRAPIKIALFDSITNEAITRGPLSSLKAMVVVLNADFEPLDREDWTAEEFDRNVVKTREGRRPLVAGEVAVSLQNGVGYIGDISLTDNSSWIRSGKFRLGTKAAAGESGGVKEGFSNAFKVKDHRGESYQKHHPPCLDDEVWRLEKIRKDGPSHKKLSQYGICCVRDFLRFYFTDQLGLREILHKATNKTWETIVRHAQTCTLDDKKYKYRTPQGAALLFNSKFEAIGIAFDGRSYISLNGLDTYQTNVLVYMKQQAYKNLSEWVPFCDPSIVGLPMLLESPEDGNPSLHGVDLREQEMNCHHPTISRPHIAEPEQDDCSFEFRESSNSEQSLNKKFNHGYKTSYSYPPAEFDVGEHDTSVSGVNYIISPRLSLDELPFDDSFEAELPTWHDSSSVFYPWNNEMNIISLNSGTHISRNEPPRARWCKILVVVKWRILVRRHVAARKWRSSFVYVEI